MVRGKCTSIGTKEETVPRLANVGSLRDKGKRSKPRKTNYVKTSAKNDRGGRKKKGPNQNRQDSKAHVAKPEKMQKRSGSWFQWK